MTKFHTFHTYGRRPLHDFPNPDIVHEKLKNGEVAYVQDEDTGYVYILTNRLYNWTMIDESMIVHERGRNMNKYMEEFKEMLLKFQSNYPKHGKMLYVRIDELKELVSFIKKVCEKAQMYDDLCK